MKRLISIIFLLISVSTLQAKEQLIYTQTSRSESLTSTVNSIYKEKDGDVWLGTPNGLYRFNGYELQHYQDSLLSQRNIFHIDQDSKGNLWLLTDKWVFIRNADRNDFQCLSIPGSDTDMWFYSLAQDDKGVWLGSIGKLLRYDFEDGSFRVFKNMEERPSFIFHSIDIIDENTLLCSSHNGLIFIDTQSGEISDTPYDSFNEVTDVLRDGAGNIWISFYNHGIHVFKEDGTLIRRYNTSNSGLSNDIVLCMTRRGSTIWAGTDGGGINIIDPQTDKITVLSHISGDSSSFPANSVKSIYTDHYDNIWVGSIRDGLIQIRGSGMKTYPDAHIGTAKGLSNPSVLCLHQDKGEEYIWIGTDGEGINRYNPSSDSFTHYPSTFKMKVVSIASYSEQELAISVYADRIWLFNKQTGRIRPLEIQDEAINYFLKYAGRSINLINDRNGDLLFITNTVSHFDRKTGTCTGIPMADKKKPSSNLYTISYTEEGLWMHDMYSIYLLPEGSSEIIKKATNNRHIINCGHMFDNDGTIWLATTDGLCRFNTASASFSHVETSLPETATSILCDRKSRVWIGTKNNLFAYLSDQDSFTMFGQSDGAEHNEYLSKARLLSSSGDIYLGGVQGLLKINHEHEIDDSETPTLSLYGISADDIDIFADKKNTHVIPRNSKKINVSVAAHEKDIFRQKMYRYVFSNGGPTFETTSPSLDIMPLPHPGKYKVSVTCTKKDGNWIEPVTIAKIRIPQPWYLSGWFICTSAAIILLFVLSTIITISNRKAHRLEIALKEQEQKIYEEKVRMLINISHELRTPLTLIMAPLKRLLHDKEDNDSETLTLRRVYRQSLRMRDLLNMVLDLRKMEVGKNRLKTAEVDINRWIREVTGDIVEEEHAESIDIRLNLSPEIPPVELDKQKCDTVMMNLLINAVKHSKSGDIIEIKTVLSGSDRVRVSISDQGPGLGDIDNSKLFTRFYQSNSEQYGSGIGLSYSKILVELHGGNIGAENNPDKGASFWWEIPLRSCPEEDKSAPGKAYLNELLGHAAKHDINISDSETFNLSKTRLMLVDDNQDLLEFMKEALSGEFAEIITLTGGNKAFAYLEKGNLPEIIVSDINMPDGDGYSLCSRVKNDDRFVHIPVILLTAKGEEQSQSDSYKIGADAFLSKPFEIETLLEMARGLIKRKAEIKKQYLDTASEDASAYRSNEESLILKLNRVISEHINDPDLDQTMLCRELGISRASLFNKMKALTGTGTKEYINRIRLEKAKNLIETTDLSIAEITDLTGFASQSYFSTAFKNFTGMSPSQYKKARRN